MNFADKILFFMCIINSITFGSVHNPSKFPGYFQPSNGVQLRQSSNTQFRSGGDPPLRIVTDLIEKFGYPVETHEVETEDGYILTMFRIPHGKNKTVPRRKPVLLHHGLFGCAAFWLSNTPDKLLVLQMADLGFDIWLANVRGNGYSSKHRSLNSNEKRFFQFSVDDIGKYDVPAEISYVLETTGAPNLVFVGHSMGGPVFHIAMDKFPEYNDKISLMIGLSPASYAGQTPLPLFLASLGPIRQFIYDLISEPTGEIFAKWARDIILLLARIVCQLPVLDRLVCEIVSNTLFGPSVQNQMNLIATQLSLYLSPTSQSTLEQFFQWISSRRFQHYDLGSYGNMKMYGEAVPPLHHLNCTTAPVAYFYGSTDMLVPPEDVLRAADELPNLVLLHRVNLHKWNHVDVMNANDVNELLNKDIIDLILKY